MNADNHMRKKTRRIMLGNLAVGGGAPVSVQTMTKTDTRDVDATVSQISRIEAAGCDIVRLAVVDEDAARALRDIKMQTTMPLIADIHFNHRLALLAIESGVDGLRINPGNIGGSGNVKEVVSAARERRLPIRIGVNSGSIEPAIEARYGNTAEALVESALGHVALLEELDYHEIKISVKASDVIRTLAAYRLLSARCDYPLHLGVTEAGTFLAGTVRSSLGIGILLSEGIGDTIRVSLTDTPEREVAVGLELLRALELRAGGAAVISCPTCGRVQVDVAGLAGEVEVALESFYRDSPVVRRPVVAVMGCMVNGPGEARHADIALAGGQGKYALYRNGEMICTVNEKDALQTLIKTVEEWCADVS